MEWATSEPAELFLLRVGHGCGPHTYHASGPFKDRSSTESPLGEVEEGPEEGLTLSVMETLPRPKYSWRRNRDSAEGKMRHCQAKWE